MTSFQRFKRDIRSRSNSRVKSQIRKVNSKNQPRIHDYLNFSDTKIVFVLDPKVHEAVFKLTMTNLTGYKLYFKIRCNNSKCYTVTPFEEVIHDSQAIQVRFQFLPKLYELGGNFNDKFQVLWGKIPDQPSQQTTLTESKVFPVLIREKNQQGTQQILKDRRQGSNYVNIDRQINNYLVGVNNASASYINNSNFNSRYKNNQTYQSPIPTTQPYFNKAEIQGQPSLQQLQKEKIFEAMLQSSLPYKSLLTKTNIIFVSIVFFILGFVFS